MALPTSDSIKVYEKIKIALGFIALDRTKGTGEGNKVTFPTSYFFAFLFPPKPTRAVFQLD